MTAMFAPKLEPDRDQIEIFVDAMFRYADPKGFVSLRSFEEGTGKPRVTATGLKGGLKFLIDAAMDDARRAAQNPKPVVFCPPIATFLDKQGATEKDLLEGLALSVECDQRPQEAREKLERLLGPATLVVKSGGTWIDPAGAAQDKLHLHWRLAKAARGPDLAKLKSARELAARLVGGDPSNTPVCHPIRWPGSYHRKGEPRLCTIDVANPDREIMLDGALAILEAEAPAQTAAILAGPGSDTTDLVQSIIAGSDLHHSTTTLAMKLLVAGMSDATAVTHVRALLMASVARAQRPKDWQVRFDDIPRAVSTARAKIPPTLNDNNRGTPDSGPREQVLIEGETAAAAPIKFTPTPFQWREPSTIPRRQWLYGRHYTRGFVGATLAPGGVGKSSQALVEAMAMASGRNLLGFQPGSGLKVWYVNLEDPREEIERRVAAICLHHGIKPEETEGRFFFDGRETEIVVATQTKSGAVIAVPVIAALKEAITANAIDVVTIDPFVSVHRVSENDNNAIDAVAKALGRLAGETNTAIELVHHTRKNGGAELTAEDGRGASAQVAAARSVRVLNRMTNEQADQVGIEAEQRRRFFRVEIDKANLAPPAKATWYIILGVALGNGSGEPIDDQDYVGVVDAWKWPDPFETVTVADLQEVKRAIASGRWRADSQAKDWVGIAVARALKMDLNTKPQKARIKALIKTWIGNGVLIRVEGEDNYRSKVGFIEVAPQ